MEKYYGMTKEDMLDPAVVDEWDDDRIDDRILIQFLREVAEIPMPKDIEAFSELNPDIDRRRWYPIYMAKAAVALWEAYDEGDRVRKGFEDYQDFEDVAWLTPKKVLNAAFIWDRG